MSKLLFAAALAVVVVGVTPVAAQALEAKPPGDAAPVMIVDTATFVKLATGSNQFEIQSSQLAKDKATSDDLKALADLIIADHTRASEKLKETLGGKGQAVVAAPPAPKQQEMLEQLQGASGLDFDTLYLDMQAQAHMEAVALFRTYAGSGEDQSVVGFARETLPRLEMHLGHVKEIIAGQ